MKVNKTPIKINSNYVLNLKVTFHYVDVCLSKVTPNEKGLAFVGELVFRQPIAEAQ
jgi:hypothetical protein